MKKIFILLFLSLLCSVKLIAQLPPAVALFEKMYGDSAENRPTVIKAFGDGIYVAGYRVINGNDFGTFTKFDLFSGALVWEKQLSMPSQILDFEHIPVTTPGTPEGFLLVGRTPFAASPQPLNNRSFLLRLDDNGTEVFFKNFDQTGREHFDRIVRHPFPADKIFPYYIIGRKNPLNQPQTGFDKVVLYNIDDDGLHKWGREYAYNAFPADDEFHRGLIPLSNGNLLMVGNDVPNNDGILVTVSGNTGAVVGSGTRYNQSLDIYDGLQLPDGNIAIVGEYFAPNIADRGAFIEILSSSLNPLVGKLFPSLVNFKDIWTDQFGSLWTIGENKDLNLSDYQVIQEINYTITPTNPILTASSGRYLDDGETDFSNGVISVTPSHDRIFYADARKVNPSGFGNWDILVGSYDLSLNSACAQDYDRGSSNFTFTKTDVPVSSMVIPEPPFDTVISIIPFQYGCNNFCDSCNLVIGFDALPVNCFEMDFIGFASGGTPAYAYSWDFNFDGIVDATGPNPPNFAFPMGGAYSVGLTVTDAAGCTQSIVQVVNVPMDFGLPILSCPAGNLTFPTDPGVCFATRDLVQVIDNCDSNPMVTCVLTGALSGSFTGTAPIQFPKGTTLVFCTATDATGNLSTCAFSVTVVDQELPTITCPASQNLSTPFCTQGKTVNFNAPMISDNCPMATFSCTHRSGDFFPCGTTTVFCTATDMAGNTAVCSFQINITCTCAAVASSSIECGPDPDTYSFTLTVDNLSGSGLPCNLNTTLPTTQGTFPAIPTITWNVGNTVATITGTIVSVVPIPSQFNLTVNSVCICADGTQTSCPLTVDLTPICCKKVFLDDFEICEESPSHPVSVYFGGSVANITQVDWYLANEICPASTSSPGWSLYATTFSTTTDVFPPYLTGDFCMYAVVSVGDFPCQTLTSNIAHFKLCKPVTCTLPSQEFCYSGSPVTPALIQIQVAATQCSYVIDWLDAAGNLISALQGQTSYQPSAVNWSGLPGDCKQAFTFSAQVSGPCGPRVCTSTVTLYDEAAPAGMLTMDPPEGQAFCPGEDATLKFTTECPEPPPPVTWTWLSSTDNLVFVQIQGSGMMNPPIHTNRLWLDTWFSVETQNGVCPIDEVKYFTDVYDPLTLTGFSANYDNVCDPTGVTMSFNINSCNTTGGPCNCDYTLEWYKDGNVVHTDLNVPGPLASYTYYPVSPDVIAGNYYVVVTDNCCEQKVKSDVIEVAPPCELVVLGPCFNCNDDEQTIEAVILNPMPGVTCSYFWATEMSGTIMSGQNTSQITVETGGHYLVTVTCTNGCTKTGRFDLKQCKSDALGCGFVSVDELLPQRSSPVKIFPNPSAGLITLEWKDASPKNGTVFITDLSGRIVHTLNIPDASKQITLDLSDLPSGLYFIKITADGQPLTVAKVVKE